MKSFAAAVPDVEIMLSLEPEEVAAKLLFLIRSEHGYGQFHPGNLIGEIYHTNDPPYPRERKTEVELAFREAYAWMQAQGLVVPSNSEGNGWLVLTRRAQRIEDDESFEKLMAASRLPREMLHPTIREKAWLSFVRRDYDVAIMQAFKAVEVEVRTAGGYAETDLGVQLMRRAFHPTDGPLTDRSTVDAEREARSSMFAGAIGSYKNPHSHRYVNLDDPTEAAELIMFASHLLRIVDGVKKNPP